MYDGEYYNKNGSLSKSMHMGYIKCKSWRIDPLVKSPVPEAKQEEGQSHDSIDQSGEKINRDSDFKEINKGKNYLMIHLKKIESKRAKSLLRESEANKKLLEGENSM